MTCEYFNEIADSYLSDELAVETNHLVIRHLESCAACRRELGKRREIRDRLRLSLKNSPEFSIDPAFAARLRIGLKESGMPSRYPRLSWSFLIPAFTTLLVIGALSFAWLYQDKDNYLVRQYLFEVSQQAIERHQDCGLGLLKQWEAETGELSSEKTAFVKSLQTPDTEILEVHDCYFGEKRFTHYILRRGERVFSVLRTESDTAIASKTTSGHSIASDSDGGLRVASFQSGNEAIFVVSEMSETENLDIARTLFDSIAA